MEKLSTHFSRRFKQVYLNTSDDSTFRSEARKYKKLYADLGMDIAKGYSEAVDQIYEEIFINQGENSLARYMSSTLDEKKQLEKLKMAYKQQRDYYVNQLRDPFFEQQKRCCHSWSDVDIAVHQYEGWVSMAPYVEDYMSMYGCDAALATIMNQWYENSKFIDCLLALLWDVDRAEDSFIKQTRCRIVSSVGMEQKYFGIVKQNFSVKIMPHILDNPFKLLYMYLRNIFIRRHLIVSLPDIAREFSAIKSFVVKYEQKTVYYLHDVADIWSQMMNLDNNVYDAIKKQFQKLKFMESFKVNGIYQFPNIYIPLAEYMYYRKKGRYKKEYLDVYGRDLIILKRYAPVLRALLNGDNAILDQYNVIRDYFDNEYAQLFSTLNDQYQSKLFEILVGGFCRIYYSVLGLDRNIIYPDWNTSGEY